MADEVKTAAPATPAAAEKPAVEKQTNCLGCGKPLKKIKTYYRDGKYFCIKKCWRTFLEKSKAEAAEKK